MSITLKPPFLSGVHAWKPAYTVPALVALADLAGWQHFVIDLRGVAHKLQFLDKCAQVMAFPSYARRNWDAFEECVNDLSWTHAPGYLLLLDRSRRFATNDSESWQTALDILREAAAHWQSRGITFSVLVRGIII